ncbi:DUF4260 family protein [Streptomyces caatingaensis]|uniref:DUF4260 family protein n=1 Tax=Streptomyces caatingaensis TaxID=1678637 RepID=A0A0K9XL39_9ACTN|nr:DUF4260 family protein [Streptomyces caatingaensis]KNB54050.1 hypothetical protein AC230_05765 [Streptomyces caatingaensis]
MTATVPASPRASAAVRRRAAWAVWAVALLALAVVAGTGHGGGVWAAFAAGAVAPDLSFLAALGAREPVRRGQLPRRAVPFYNAAHRTPVPLVLAVAYGFSPLDAPAVFAFLLAWTFHIAVDRAAGYTLRTPEGFVRA